MLDCLAAIHFDRHEEIADRWLASVEAEAEPKKYLRRRGPELLVSPKRLQLAHDDAFE